jgi:hypothetical protein
MAEWEGVMDVVDDIPTEIVFIDSSPFGSYFQSNEEPLPMYA